MIKKYLIILQISASAFFMNAQTVNISPDSTKKSSKTEIEILYNQYIQDGNHSAVTGGVGTEKLTVYGPSARFKRTFSKNSFGLKVGSDIITSASTDKIDFIESSASYRDLRNHVDISFSRDFKSFTANIGLGASLESDYFSFAKSIGLSKISKDKMQTFSLQFQAFNDDLRWGLLNPKYKRPTKLVIPEELRNKEWYTDDHRNTYNLNFGFSQIINKRNVLSLNLLLTRQDGLLATPFHRIYFSDGTKGVEQLPYLRQKMAVLIQWNSFVKGNIILKNTINTYLDDFGVKSLSLGNETIVKINPKWGIAPSFRFYAQTASDYFEIYKKHDSSSEFFTSDYDFSKLESYKLGLGVHYRPYKTFGKHGKLPLVYLKYRYYYRSDGLVANVVMFGLRVEWD